MHRYTLRRGDDPEVRAAALWAAGATGVWEQGEGADGRLVGFFPAPTDRVPPGGRWEEEPDVDWLAEWRAGLGAVRVGRVEVAPPWHAPPPPTGVVRVRIDPAMAFGTGHHATTRVCLQALQDVEVGGERVLDVGTGSGVLAIAATLLGAAAVTAVDTDPRAVDEARANAARNGVALDVRHGSLEAVGADPPFDVVVANLVSDTLVDLAPALVGVAAPAGALIVSGVSRPRVPDVAAALVGAGAAPVEIRAEEDWVALVAVVGEGQRTE